MLSFRYKIDEDFQINQGIERIDNLEATLKTKQAELTRLEAEKTADTKEAKNALEESRKQVGNLRDQVKSNFREVKTAIGTELYNRFVKGFVRTRDNAEENDRIAHSEFLFKKLKF